MTSLAEWGFHIGFPETDRIEFGEVDFSKHGVFHLKCNNPKWSLHLGSNPKESKARTATEPGDFMVHEWELEDDRKSSVGTVEETIDHRDPRVIETSVTLRTKEGETLAQLRLPSWPFSSPFDIDRWKKDILLASYDTIAVDATGGALSKAHYATEEAPPRGLHTHPFVFLTPEGTPSARGIPHQPFMAAEPWTLTRTTPSIGMLYPTVHHLLIVCHWRIVRPERIVVPF